MGIFKSDIREKYEQLRREVSIKIATREALIDCKEDLLIIADSEGRIRKVNKNTLKLLGYTEGEIYSLNYWDLIHPEDKKKTREIVKETLSTGARVIDFVCRIHNKGGEYLCLSFHTVTGKEGIFYNKAKLANNG